MQRLTEGSIRVGLFKFSLPILLANILQSLNGSVNSIWVGRFLGEAALTATSNANIVMFLLIGAAFGVALAATILIGQYIGANNLPEAKRVVGTSATFFAGISVAMAVTGLALCRPLLIAMNTPADSLPLAVAYMRVIFLALPCLYMYAFVGAVLRGAGDSKTPFYFMLLSVGMQIWNYIQMPAFAVGMGMSAMTAQNVGAGKWDRVTRIARVGVLYSVLLTGSIVLLIELLDTAVFGLFLPAGSAALSIASHLNRIVTGSFIFFGISVALFGVVRATGAVMAPFVILAVSLLVVRFPLAQLFLDRYQADAVWWSFPVSSVLSALLAALYYRYGGWRQAHMLSAVTT